MGPFLFFIYSFIISSCLILSPCILYSSEQQGGLGSGTIKIISPSSGDIYSFGEVITVKIDAQDTVERLMIIGACPYSNAGEIITLDKKPFQPQKLVMPKECMGPSTVGVVAWPQNSDIPDIKSVPVHIILSEAVEAVKIISDNKIVLVSGKSLELRVKAIFSDGVKRGITSAETGTKYEIAEGAEFISVSKDGLVKALNEGDAKIKISNGKASLIILVHIYR